MSHVIRNNDFIISKQLELMTRCYMSHSRTFELKGMAIKCTNSLINIFCFGVIHSSSDYSFLNNSELCPNPIGIGS